MPWATPAPQARGHAHPGSPRGRAWRARAPSAPRRPGPPTGRPVRCSNRASVLDFDHRDPANQPFRLTSSRAMLASEATLRQELEKCDVVCANCHRVRTMRTAPNQRPNRTAARSNATQRWSINRRAQLMVLAELRDSPCRDRGRRLPWYAMEYDHRDPKAKVDEVMRMAGHAGLDRILAEVARCDIVCSNCHRDRTHRRRGAATSERE